MQYEKLLNVTKGIQAQIDACLNALDKHEALPDEAEQLGTVLAEAHSLCGDIIKKGEEEQEDAEEASHHAPTS